MLVDDDQSGRFRDFLVAPLRRGQLVLGYLLSAVAVAVILSLLVFVISLLYLGLVRETWLSAAVDRTDRRGGAALVHRVHLDFGAHRVVRPHERRLFGRSRRSSAPCSDS